MLGSPLGWSSSWRYTVTTWGSHRRARGPLISIRDGGRFDYQETSSCSPRCVWGPRDATGRETVFVLLRAPPVRPGCGFPAVLVANWAHFDTRRKKTYWPFSAGGNTREAWQAQSWRPLHRRSTQTSRPMCRKHQSPPGSIPPTLSTGPSALWGAMSTKGSCRRSAPKAHVSKCSSVAHTQHPRGNTVLPAIKSS